MTRKNWNGQGAGQQIDFVLASSNLDLAEVTVEQHLSCDTDHRPVCCEFVLDAPAQWTNLGRKCLKNWKPDVEWEAQTNDRLDTWDVNWEAAADLLRKIADDCKLVKANTKDRYLQDMVAAVSTTPWEERNDLFKRIWRRRRHLKRMKHTEGLQQAAEAGRAPPGPRPSRHLNWGKSWATRASSQTRSSPTTLRNSTDCQRRRHWQRRRREKTL